MHSDQSPYPLFAQRRVHAVIPYAGSALACLVTALVATPLREYLDLANVVLLFLLTVLLVTLRAGRGPGVMAAVLCVALFDLLFVPPRFSFAVGDVQYVVTLAVMLAVALITAQLTAGVRQQAELASRSEQETRSLYELARELAGTASIEHVAEIAERFVRTTTGMRAVLLVPGTNDSLVPARSDSGALDYLEERLARRAYEHGEIVGAAALAQNGQAIAYLPLKAPMRVRGTLVVASSENENAHRMNALRAPLALSAFPPSGSEPSFGRPGGGLMPLLGAVSSLLAIAVERLHYVDVAQATEVEMTSERLRNSILAALSHDVRTPLTALVGLADSLALYRPGLPVPARELAEALREQATRMNGMVSNLLDMARLQSGRVRLAKEWQLLEEVVGASLQLLAPALAGHEVDVDLPKDPTLIEFDAVLIERVLCNLLENAAKYSPEQSSIAITARLANGFASISVLDRGRGFPAGRHEELFGMFVRGSPESSAPGAGLGLAICRAIVDAHGGTIRAANRANGGAEVTFTLPLGSPPRIEEERDAEVRAASHE
jgi:two-component system sensor histidine kinase KdpD